MVPRLVVSIFLVLSAVVSSAVPQRIPPLLETPTNVQIPGKFVWADLFSTEPNTSARFYGALFDWTSRTFTDEGGKYVMLRSAHGPVTGVVRGPDRKDDRPSARWVGYISSPDVDAGAEKIVASGGRILAGPLPVPERGNHLIAADAEGALFGLMDSTTGDPADDEVQVGGLLWFNLFAHNPEGAAEFYGSVGQFESAPWRTEGTILSAGDRGRAGISKLDRNTTATPTWVPFFKVADIDRKLKVAKRLGAKVVIEKLTVETGTQIAVLADTLGAVFALAQVPETAEESP